MEWNDVFCENMNSWACQIRKGNKAIGKQSTVVQCKDGKSNLNIKFRPFIATLGLLEEETTSWLEKCLSQLGWFLASVFCRLFWMEITL